MATATNNARLTITVTDLAPIDSTSASFYGEFRPLTLRPLDFSCCNVVSASLYPLTSNGTAFLQFAAPPSVWIDTNPLPDILGGFFFPPGFDYYLEWSFWVSSGNVITVLGDLALCVVLEFSNRQPVPPGPAGVYWNGVLES